MHITRTLREQISSLARVDAWVYFCSAWSKQHVTEPQLSHATFVNTLRLAGVYTANYTDLRSIRDVVAVNLFHRQVNTVAESCC